MSEDQTRLSVSIIGGYLGAGKTTLVNHLLRHANGLRLAVLVNEFGALPIDADLIEAEEDGLISIAGGCICCSFGNDLTAALIDLADLDPAPDHVLIETSGVAIPSSIALNLSLIERYQLSGTVVLADAETILDQCRNEYVGDTIVRQVQDADLLLVTKSDLVNAQDLQATVLALQKLNPSPVLSISNGIAPISVVLGENSRPSDLPQMSHADSAFESLIFEADEGVDASDLAKILADDPAVIRAKGFVPNGGSAREIQIVGQRFTVTDRADPPHFSVVCIGLRGNLNEVSLKRVFGS